MSSYCCVDGTPSNKPERSDLRTSQIAPLGRCRRSTVDRQGTCPWAGRPCYCRHNSILLSYQIISLPTNPNLKSEISDLKCFIKRHLHRFHDFKNRAGTAICFMPIPTQATETGDGKQDMLFNPMIGSFISTAASAVNEAGGAAYQLVAEGDAGAVRRHRVASTPPTTPRLKSQLQTVLNLCSHPEVDAGIHRPRGVVQPAPRAHMKDLPALLVATRCRSSRPV